MSEEYPMGDLPDVHDIRRVSLAENEHLAILTPEDTNFDGAQRLAVRVAEILGVDRERVVVMCGVNDLIAVEAMP